MGMPTALNPCTILLFRPVPLLINIEIDESLDTEERYGHNESRSTEEWGLEGHYENEHLSG